jgi:hypothetical protein
MTRRFIAIASMALFASGIAAADDAKPFSTVSVGVEFPFLAVHSNHGAGGATAGGDSWFDDGFDDRFAHRVTVSTNLLEEFGVRARHFQFDAGIGDDGGPDTDLFFKMSMWDIEGTADAKLGKWDLVVSAGARQANIKYPEDEGGDEFAFDGWGFTAALDARRAFDNGIAIVAGVRHSQLFGDSRLVDDPTTNNTNNVVPITEFRAGIEYAHPVFAGGLVTFGLHYEATLMSSLSAFVDDNIDPEDTDIGLMGPAASIKLTIDPSKL